ncbi:hypothetical protein VTP01DRAFT_6698 [Rhizomucor pusillus]|uniref:uncharacterized protein n=1 Tax=Rhizomucor pusillus TaxID=4840 RepID=UPI0037443B53
MHNAVSFRNLYIWPLKQTFSNVEMQSIKKCTGMGWDGTVTWLTKGNIDLPLPQPPPEPLQSLWKENNAAARDFRQNVRACNNAFAFSSLGVTLDETVVNAIHGAYSFRFQEEYRIVSVLCFQKMDRHRYSHKYLL